MNRSLFAASLLAVACTAPIGGDPYDTDDTDEPLLEAQSHAVVTTTDFSVGGLSTVAFADHTVADDLVPTSSDPSVQVIGDRVFQVNSFGSDTISVYAPGAWSAPLAQFSTGTGTNPKQVARIGDALFVTLYEVDFVGVFDPSDGASLGTVDLADHAGSDDVPEAASILVRAGRLFVALERLDRDDGWGDDGGLVVEIDPVAREVVKSWEVGPNPSLAAHPLLPGALVVRTGLYGQTDGGLRVLDPDDDAAEAPFLTEDDLGYAVAEYVSYGGIASGRGLIIAEHPDFTYSLKCVDLDGTVTHAYGPTADWLTGAAVDDQGRAWVASRSFDGASGLVVVDLDACEAADSLIETALPPYRIAFY